MANVIVNSCYIKSLQHFINYLEYAGKKLEAQTLVLNDGTKIELDPDELLDISETPDFRYIQLELKDGTIRRLGTDKYQKYVSAQTEKYNDSEVYADNKFPEGDKFEARDPEIYLDYIAHRPGVEKNPDLSHGLFGINGAIDMEAAKNSVLENENSIKWSHIISLTREGAEATGFDNRQSWENLIRSKAYDIGKLYNIPPEHLEIMAAYHDKAHHPHCHLFFFSNANTTAEGCAGFAEGDLEKKSQKLRSIFNNEIFKDEVNYLKTERQQLRKELNEELKCFVQEIGKKNYDPDKEIITAFTALSDSLSDYTGRAYYSYISPENKQKVCEFLHTAVSSDENLYQIYNKILENQRSFVSMYNDDAEKINNRLKQFEEHFFEPNGKNDSRQLHNIIIEQALLFNQEIPLQNKYWNDTFKQARADLAEAVTLPDEYKQPELDRILNVFTNEAEHGNDIAAYELGRYYKLGTFGSIDPELSSEYFYMAFSGFSDKLNSDFWLEPMIAASEFGLNHPNASQKEIFNLTKTAEKNEWLYNYLTYRKGRMLLNGEGCKKNIPEGISYLEESSSPFAAYTLGNLYYYGKDDIAPDYQKAYTHFSDAAFPDSGEEPMPFALYNMAEMIEKELVKESALSVDELYSKALTAFISSDKDNPNDMIEYRIASMLLDGKGCKIDKERAKEYLTKSSKVGNTYAQTKLANLYLSSVNSEDAKTAVLLLQAAAACGNDIAQYQLGKIYLNESTEYYNVDKGLKLLEKSSRQENSFAEYTLGKVYFEGNIVKRNIKTAMKHLETSARQNNQFAQYMLGMIYLNGEDDLIEINTPNAVKYLSSSAEQGNNFARYYLGKLYLENKDIKNIETALEYLKSADDKENPYLQYSLGRTYLENEDIRNIKAAIEHLTASADKKNPFAAYALGRLFSEDEFIQSDEEVADKWYAKAYKEFNAIEQNPDIVTDDSVLYHLGVMNYKGLGTQKNINAAVDYLLKAAHNDYEPAQYFLGKIYLADESIKRNAEYAVQWLQKSADKGNQYAQYLLGKTLIDDSSVQDIPKAVEYLTKSAEQNNEFAQYALGKIYLDGNIVPKDVYAALKYLEASAEQNNPFAQYKLGKYLLNDVISHNSFGYNFGIGLNWLKESANQNNQYAQYELGKIYLSDEFGVKNINAAIRYLNKSANQNNQFAQYQLGKLYYYGTEIPQDIEKAVAYFTASAKQGNIFAQRKLYYISNPDTYKTSYAASLLLSRIANAMSNLAMQYAYNMQQRQEDEEEYKEQPKFASKNHQRSKSHLTIQTPISR